MGILWQTLVSAVRSTATRRILLGAAFFLFTTLLLFANHDSEEIDLKAGQICPFDITAPRGAVLIDELRTAELKQQAAASVQKVYQEDEEAAQDAQKAAQQLYQRINELRINQEFDESVKLTKFKEILQSELILYQKVDEVVTDRLLLTILRADESAFNHLIGETNRLIEVVMARPLKEEDLAEAREQADIEVRRLNLKDDYKKWLTIILQNSLRPSLVLNQEATDRLIEEAQSKVLPVQMNIKQGQIIVRKGDPVTAEDLEILRQLGLLRLKSAWITLGGLALLVLLVMAVCLIFLRQYHYEVLKNEPLMILLCLLVFITLLAARAVSAINISDRPEAASTIGYLIPMAAGSMLISILVDCRIGVLGTIIMSIFVGIIAGGQDISFVVVALISGLVGVYSVSKVNQGWDLAKGGILVGGVNVLVVVALSLMAYESTVISVLWGAFYGLLNGLLSGIVAIGILPYLETIFGITSTIRLLELVNPNHPLLKRLLLEAPGTYHHSIVVGNLAEAAAEAVGAQPLLVRVGAYYHDVGKLKRPYFFIENQLGSENPHDKIAPSLSSLIITSHPKDGVELAQQYRLPQVVCDIISQHHGNSLVSYFYQKAREQDQYDSVQESTYRYDAPKPQTKEAALVMLADSIEAAVRSLQKPTPGRIEGLVRRIVKERLNDGQLEECDLTFKDVNLITEAFLRILNGMHHNRSEYPDAKELERRRGKGVSTGSESAKSAAPAPRFAASAGGDGGLGSPGASGASQNGG
ncbi:MAG: HDIG domain-containing protein [Syntrophomonadaceae bacterium]|nr:HDIG domain-containing protein [Syntrophomonadaceae bacterium]